jgi:hypothetical protein
MNKTEDFEAFILVYPNGKLVGIDHSSGGYPYAIDSFYVINLSLTYCWISKVELFITKEKAEEYQRHFKELTIKKVKFKTEIVDLI